MRKRRSPLRHWRLGVLLALLGAGAAAYHLTGLREALDPEQITRARLAVEGLGWRGIGIFLLVYMIIIAAGLPNFPLQFVAGAMFGFWRGYLLILIGLNLGALAAFELARGLGRRAIEELFRKRIKAANASIERGGLRTMLVLRLTPIMPFNLVNFAAGMSRLKRRDFILANLVGMLPMTYIHVSLGSAANKLELLDPRTWTDRRVFIPLALCVALLALTLALQFASRRTGKGGDSA